MWNTLPSDHTDFSSFAAYKRPVQQIDFQRFYYVIDLVFLGYCQCHLWPSNPVHTCLHVYVVTFMYVSMCENKDADDDDFLWPPYVIGGPLYFCPVVSFFFFFYLLLFFFLA